MIGSCNRDVTLLQIKETHSPFLPPFIVTGQRGFEGNGCILADDMGLGKTLQSIVVLYTLLKNGFKPGERFAKKALVVTPTRLARLLHRTFLISILPFFLKETIHE